MILAESGPHWTISDYAILSTGAINVPIYPTQPVEQVERAIDRGDADVLAALAEAVGWELPFFLGVTAGYTPSFDFDSDRDDDKRGAFNLGATLGVYVPLLDFN